ncbi:hypothetical protein wTpre_69 [Wolbachia endosymbiont of Trichogramma pretiosum]|nr:hypothetical protein wTpre_69 [Wolbachia endosymbiont of Trichogramma pretiosum]
MLITILVYLAEKNNYFGYVTFTTELGKWSSDITKLTICYNY